MRRDWRGGVGGDKRVLMTGDKNVSFRNYFLVNLNIHYLCYTTKYTFIKTQPKLKYIQRNNLKL